MAAGRLIVGFGVGSAAMVVPLYIAEIAPSKVRGRMIGLNNMSITGGQVISYGIGAAFAHVPHGWRYMVGLGGVPAIMLACLLPFCPESPRQLIYHGKLQQAEAVLQKIYASATPEQVRAKTALIAAACEEAKEIAGTATRWEKVKMLHTNPANFRALVCACGLMVISQMSGFNTLMYYSSTLFALVGFSNPVAVGLVVAGTNFVMTWVNMMMVDPFGRRRLLICTFPSALTSFSQVLRTLTLSNFQGLGHERWITFGRYCIPLHSSQHAYSGPRSNNRVCSGHRRFGLHYLVRILLWCFSRKYGLDEHRLLSHGKQICPLTRVTLF